MLLTITIVFSVLQVVFTFLLFISSIHGPNSLPPFAIVWLGLAQMVIWSCHGKFRKGDKIYTALYQIIIGLVTTGTGPGVLFISEKYDAYKWNFRVENTKIYDVHDELLFTEDGDPFGIQFSFKAEFPETNYYYISPLLRPQISPSGRKPDPNDMRVLNFSAKPPLKHEYYFKKGVVYDIVFDMVPGYLWSNPQSQPAKNNLKTKYCMQYPTVNIQVLTRNEFEAIITNDIPEKYETMLHGTSYGDYHSGKGLTYTLNEYNPNDFYTTYKKNELEECKPFQPPG